MSILKNVYNLSFNLRNLKPWTYLDESDVFGVQIPGSDKKYFVSIMGGGGEHYAIAAYEGPVALLDFWTLSDPDSWFRPADLLTIPHLMVSFENMSEIEPRTRKAIKDFGFNIMGKKAWPDLKQCIPGFVPHFPEQEALADLEVILEQVLHVVGRAKSSTYFIMPENMDNDMYLMRVNTSPGSDKWEDTYWKLELPVTEFEMLFSDDDRKSLKGLMQTNKVLQADISITNKVVAPPGEKPYFSCIYILMDKTSHMALDFELLPPHEGLDAVYARIPQLIIESLLKLRWRPEVIEFRHPMLYEMTQKVLSASKITSSLKNRLNAVDDFLENFTEASL